VPDLKTYDPGEIAGTFKGVPFLGFMDGTAISVSRSEDSWEMTVGSQGDGARVRKRNRSGVVTLTLQQTSPTNAKLAAIAELDEESGTGTGELFIKDLLGNDLIVAEIAWIVKPPDMEYGDTLSGREWNFACHELRMYAGGGVV
jgi:hypothetical protein